MDLDPTLFWPGMPGVIEAPPPPPSYADAWAAFTWCYLIFGIAVSGAVPIFVKPVREWTDRLAASWGPILARSARSLPIMLGVMATYLSFMLIMAIGTQFWPL